MSRSTDEIPAPRMVPRRPGTFAVMLAVALLAWPSLTTAAGNVTVRFVRGVLRVTGDAEDNKIALVSEGVGQVEVGSFDPAGTLNHVMGGTFVAEGVRDVIVSLGAGDDWINLLDVHAPGVLRLDTGRGNDTINGQDTGAGTLQILTGPGDDTIGWDGGGCKSLKISTGAGTDDLSLSAFNVDGDTFIDMGSGSDRFESFVQTFGGRVKVLVGTGDDTIAMDSSTFKGPATFDGGRGSDTFDPHHCTFDAGVTSKNFP